MKLKICSMCNKKKKAKSFGFRTGGRWLRSRCKDCEVIRSTQRSKTKIGKEIRRNSDLRIKYGISLKKFEKTKKCLICKRRVRLVADHNHTTGKYRGALCHACNFTIGWLEKFPRALEAIMKYLKRGQL